MEKNHILEKYSTFPAELKSVKQFVCWVGSDKIPKNPFTGNNAQSNNPETWGTFDDAVDACVKFNWCWLYVCPALFWC